MEYQAPSSIRDLAAPAAPSKERKPASHLPAIDGLRALAAMGVVYVHCWVSNGIHPAPQFSFWGVDLPVYQLFMPGYTGVFLFFVLSGFCLSYPFFSRPGRPDDWLNYFLSRARRILPPYIISFVILFLIGQWLRQHVEDGFFHGFCYEKFRLKHFIRELLLIKQSKIVGSYWTLVLEWRWYLLFPALLMLARRFSPALVVLLTCGIACLPHVPALAGPVNQTTFSLVLTALPMFGFGIWAAHLCAVAPEKQGAWECWMAKHAHWGVLAAIPWTVCFCPPPDNAPLQASVLAWSPLYFFLTVASIKHPLFNKVLSWGPLPKIGLFSYSLYLVQEPIIRALNQLIHRPEHGPWTYLATNFVFFPIVCILAGWGFYQIGEKPFLKRAKKS